MRGSKYCKNFQDVIQSYEVSKHCWKNGARIIAQYRVVTHLQFVYRDVLDDDFVVGELEDHLPNVLHTYKIEVD